MTASRIDRIESGTLLGRRPRIAGCNGRMAVHGIDVSVPIARLTTADGASGFGYCRAGADEAGALLGADPQALLRSLPGEAALQAWDFALWDLRGQQLGQPVYKLAAEAADAVADEPLRVPCYDTSLYIDDLHLSSDAEAADLIAAEALEGYERSQRNFKIKVGRGARHMPLDEGNRRDIAVVKAVRAALGPDCAIMLDANNAYNLNITKLVLAATADCNVFWMEEPFHEDDLVFQALRQWLDEQGLSTLIADGEGRAAVELLEWARAGWVDVIQYDIFSHGFSSWLRTGAQLDAWGIRSAPHHYGCHLGNYVSGHLAAAVAGFTFVEWDEAATPGLDASAYRVEEGQVIIPDAPGFGLELDDEVFRAAVKNGGYELRA